MFCGKCGKKIDNDSVFCHFCGNKILTESENNSNKLKKLILDDFDRYDSLAVGRELKIVKELIRLFGIRLDEAAALVKNPPTVIKENLTEEEALRYKTALESVGALMKIE